MTHTHELLLAQLAEVSSSPSTTPSTDPLVKPLSRRPLLRRVICSVSYHSSHQQGCKCFASNHATISFGARVTFIKVSNL